MPWNSANLPIGLIAGTPYSQTAIQFGPDDLLILYTDGCYRIHG